MTVLARGNHALTTLALVTAVAVVGCGDDGAPAAGSSGSSTTGQPPVGDTSPVPGTDSSGAGSTAADPDTTGDGTTDTGEVGNEECEALGLPAAPQRAGEGSDWGQVAGEFSVETTFGPWSLVESFSGCDSYVFINDVGDSTSDGLHATISEDLFLRSAPNVHYFFLSSVGDPVAGAEAWQSEVGSALFPLTREEQQYWTDRVHFVTDDPMAIAGSVGDFVVAHPDQRTFAIDRAQTWDDPGSVSDTTTGAFAPSAPVLGYVGRYYNFRYDQDVWLEDLAETTEVAMIDSVTFAPDCVVGEPCFDQQNGPFSNSNNWQPWPAQFPDANTMAGFDTMDLVVTATCGPDSYSDCGHWDYEALINLCSDPLCEGPTQEIARWITPYSRPGTRRWVIDASPLLGMVADGGTQYFNFGMIWNMNPSTWDMRFVLRNEGRADASQQVVPAFNANRGFNDAYNDAWETVEFTPPAAATRVELVAIISGHGQDEQNCAEWCNHQHEFTVNGADVHLREFPGQVVAQRCAEAVDEGVVPGQYGNWTPGCAGWCPGLPVQPWVVDITSSVQLGELNTLDYRGLFNNAPVTGNKGRIRLSSYVVFYQ
ncbi:MAG: hypothetical protein K0V04_45205 [Deltaproteobacteria bacterium]|nr:hypothetical protein [Deltaproteobacteria bacterium]